MRSNKYLEHIKYLLFIIFISPYIVNGGTTGKISGRILDFETGEPLIGANIIIVGTNLGAASDLDGYFNIINIPPGAYQLKASSIGYHSETVEGLVVNIDRTTKLNFNLKSATIGLGEDVIVVADREKVKTDVSFTQMAISAKEIKTVPVSSDVREVITFSPGVYRNDKGQIEMRGGNEDEVGVLVDDISMQNARTGVGVLNIPKGAIQEIQVIRGAFNAEYGQAQSGIINIVTKSNQTNLTGSFVVNVGPSQQKHFGPNYFSKDNYYHVGRFLEMDQVTTKMPWLGDNSDIVIFDGWNTVWSDSLIDSYTQKFGKDAKYGNNPEEALEIWKWRHRAQDYSDEPDLTFDGTLSGPVPFTDDKVTFSFAGHYNRSVYPFRFQRQDFTEYSANLKLNYAFNNDLRLSYHGILSHIEGSSLQKGSNGIADPRYWLSAARVMGQLFQSDGGTTGFYNADGYLKTNSLNLDNHALKFNYIFNNQSFMDGYVAYKRTKENADVDVPFRDFTDIVKTVGGLELDSAPYGYVKELESGYISAFDVLGIHRIGGEKINGYDFSSTTSLTLKMDYNNQINNMNLIKAGIWLLHQNLDINTGYKDVVTTESGELGFVRIKDWYKRNIPYYEFAAYLQDKIEIEGLVLNIGLRGDGLYNSEPNLPLWSEYYSQGYIEDIIYSLPDSIASTDNWKFYLSPRIGVAHPISENSKLFFNYGYFYQRPSVTRLFQNNYRPEYQSASLSTIASPNVAFRKTIQYELGYEQMVNDWFRITVSGYYRDISNELQYTELTDKNLHYYLRYFPNVFADVRGFEVNLKLPKFKYLSGWVNYDYRVKTSGDYGYSVYSELESGDRIERDANPEVTRATPELRGNLAFYSPTFENETLNSIFSDITLSFMYQWKAGQYLTYHSGNAELNKTDPFNLQWTDFSRLDMKFMKVIDLGSSELTFSFDVRNLLNAKYFHPELMDYLSSSKEYTKVTVESYLDEIDRLGLTPGDVDNSEIQHMLDQSIYWIFYGEPIQVWFGIEWNF